jgi:hypothetical protein
MPYPNNQPYLYEIYYATERGRSRSVKLPYCTANAGHRVLRACMLPQGGILRTDPSAHENARSVADSAVLWTIGSIRDLGLVERLYE